MKAPFLLNILWQSGSRACNMYRWPHWNIELFYVNNGVKSHFSQTGQHCWNLSWLARYKAVKNAAWGSPRIGCYSDTGYFPPNILLGCPNSLVQGGTLLCDKRHHNSKMSGGGAASNQLSTTYCLLLALWLLNLKSSLLSAGWRELPSEIVGDAQLLAKGVNLWL